MNDLDFLIQMMYEIMDRKYQKRDASPTVKGIVFNRVGPMLKYGGTNPDMLEWCPYVVQQFRVRYLMGAADSMKVLHPPSSSSSPASAFRVYLFVRNANTQEEVCWTFVDLTATVLQHLGVSSCIYLDHKIVTAYFLRKHKLWIPIQIRYDLDYPSSDTQLAEVIAAKPITHQQILGR
jgi:hypothetical protein